MNTRVEEESEEKSKRISVMGNQMPAENAGKDIAWMDKGTFMARIKDRQVIPGTIRHISPRGQFFQPMIHPDGTRVVWWGRKEGDAGPNVWTASIDGSDLRRLTDEGQIEAPAWSPDGRLIVYTSKKGSDWHQIWVMDADGRNKRQLTNRPMSHGRPCMSPDGTTVVFSSGMDDGPSNLWRTNLEGAEPTQVTHGCAHAFKPCFSPDGRQLAFHGVLQGPTYDRFRSPHNLAIMKWPNGEPRWPVTLKKNEWLHGPFWSADGQYVMVHGNLMGIKGLFLVDVSTDKVKPLMVPGFKGWGHASWDRAETTMVFTGQREAH